LTAPTLHPQNELTQVVFVHDYVQLHFGDEILGVFNRFDLTIHDRQFTSSEFDNGARLSIEPESDRSGTEAYQFAGRSGPIVVEQNP
jgi:hypothetical protein